MSASEVGERSRLIRASMINATRRRRPGAGSAAASMNHFDIAQFLAGAAGEGNEWLPFLEPPTLTLGLYVVRADDRETHAAHDRDEVYAVVRGRGTLRSDGQDQPVGSGSVLFVPAGQEHHFHGIEEELVLLVFFSNAQR